MNATNAAYQPLMRACISDFEKMSVATFAKETATFYLKHTFESNAPKKQEHARRKGTVGLGQSYCGKDI
jgi:hypothetical protein